MIHIFTYENERYVVEVEGGLVHGTPTELPGQLEHLIDGWYDDDLGSIQPPSASPGGVA